MVMKRGRSTRARVRLYAPKDNSESASADAPEPVGHAIGLMVVRGLGGDSMRPLLADAQDPCRERGRDCVVSRLLSGTTRASLACPRGP